MSAVTPHITAVMATYRRPHLAQRLLDSLAATGSSPASMVICDNGGDLSQTNIPSGLPFGIRVLNPGRNLGCGLGLSAAITEALADPRTTHLLMMDDDVVAVGNAVGTLLGSLSRTGADAAMPLFSNAEGVLGWSPGPLPQPAWRLIRRPGMTPATFRQLCGDDPIPWRWAPWPAILVTRRAVEAVGLPRDDYWFQGEDVEWTLRLSYRFRALLVPEALFRHLPPNETGDPGERRERKRLLHLSMLQNNLFTATRLPHGRRILRHAPGNAYRFLASQGFAPRAWLDAFRAHWLGGVRGKPGGIPGFNPWQIEYDEKFRPGA